MIHEMDNINSKCFKIMLYDCDKTILDRMRKTEKEELIIVGS